MRELAVKEQNAPSMADYVIPARRNTCPASPTRGRKSSAWQWPPCHRRRLLHCGLPPLLGRGLLGRGLYECYCLLESHFGSSQPGNQVASQSPGQAIRGPCAPATCGRMPGPQTGSTNRNRVQIDTGGPPTSQPTVCHSGSSLSDPTIVAVAQCCNQAMRQPVAE